MPPVPPKISPANRRFAWGVMALTIAGVAAVLFFFNPATHHIYPVCQFHQLTGLNCPGCGGTRARYALLHGQPAAALRDNALVVIGMAAGGVRGGWYALNRLRGRPNGHFFPSRLLLPLLVVMLVFSVLRNLPAFAFLSPP